MQIEIDYSVLKLCVLVFLSTQIQKEVLGKQKHYVPYKLIDSGNKKD